MRKSLIQKIILILIILLVSISFLPNESLAQTGIIYECTGGAPGECTFDDLINAVKKVVNWVTIFALQFSVVVIAYAGFKYMRSGDNPGERSSANKMMRSVVIGIFFILLAWLIVTLITGVLLDGDIDTFLG